MSEENEQLSPLKKQRAEKKRKKQEKKMRDEFGDTPPTWDEAKGQSLDVYNMIVQNMELIKSGYNAFSILQAKAQKEKLSESMLHAYKTLPSELTILSKDVNEFLDRWRELSEGLSGKAGEVEMNDLPGFYCVHDDIIRLGLDMTNVITSRAADITSLVVCCEEEKVEEEKPNAE